MKRWLVLGMALCLTMMAGCGSDGGSRNVEAVLLHLKDSESKLNAVTSSITKSVELHKKLQETQGDKEKKDVADKLKDELEGVKVSTNQLGEQATKLLAISQKVSPPPATEEERKDWVKKFRNRLTDNLVSLDKTRGELKVALAKAKDVLDAKTIEEIELNLKVVDGKFENLSRPN